MLRVVDEFCCFFFHVRYCCCRDQLLILCDCVQYFSSSIRFLTKQSSLFAGFFRLIQCVFFSVGLLPLYISCLLFLLLFVFLLLLLLFLLIFLFLVLCVSVYFVLIQRKRLFICCDRIQFAYLILFL